jgi:hypothetical protein
MNPRTTIGLVLALAVAVVGVWWAQSSSSKQPARTTSPGPRQLFDPALGELAGFELKAGDAAALAFAMEDGKWQMTSPVSGPTEHWTVNTDARKIKDLEYVRSYGPDDEERPTPEMTSLEKPSRIVKLTDESGKSYVLKIGVRQALSSKTYVQKEGDEAIYLVDADLNRDLSKGLSDYRGKRVAEFTPNDAVRVEVSGAHQYTLVKSGTTWTVESPIKGRADTSKVNALLRGVSNLRVVDFVDEAPPSLHPYGLASPRLRVAVTTETKTPKPPPEPPASAPAEPEYDIQTQTIRLAFGGTADEKVFAKIDEEASQGVFRVATSVLEQVGPALSEVRDKKITTINTHRAQKIVVRGQGESVELVKSDGKWQIETSQPLAESSEAEFAAVDDLLKAIRDLRAIGFETEELPTHGFDPPRAVVEVTAEGQLTPAKLVVGGLTPSKAGAYIRNDSEGFVAVVKAEAVQALQVQPLTFLSREVLQFAKARASRIEIVRQDASYTVSREGGQWKFVSPIQGLAESDRVNDILSDLSRLRGRRVVGRIADAPKFGLDAPAVTATVTVDAPAKPKKPPTTQPATEEEPEEEETPQPPTLYTVLVSKLDEKVYAMAGGSTICEVDAKILEDLEAELFNTRVAELEPAKVQSLAIAGEVEFSFEMVDGQWRLSGEPSFATDSAKVTEVCEALGNLRARRYVCYTGAAPADYGLDRPAATVTATTEDDQVVTLVISATGPEGGGRYATASVAEGRVFVIEEEEAAKFTKQVQDFRRAS